MADRIGIHEVAAAAGVSTTTVSHALNDRGKVSPGTRERVRRVAQELGYRPNRIASALRNRRTGVLGFVSDEIATTPFAGRIVLGAQEAAAERGQTLMVVNSNGDPEVERHQIEALLAQQVDALLYATMFHRVVTAPAAAARIPLVLVNATDPTSAVPSVAPDERAAGRAATQVLLEAGHRRIVHLTLTDRREAVDRRVAGHAAAMEEAGLAPRVVRVPGPGNAEAGRRAMRQALDEQPDLTAVFAFNDPMSMGVYQIAYERGLRIPDLLSVVSVDNLEIVAAELRPGLTTLELPHAAMGRWAVEEAGRLLAGAHEPVERALLEAPLVRRDSVARVV